MKTAIDHVCPRCGGDVPNSEFVGQYPGALSRTDNDTEVCSQCGTDEAIQAFNGTLIGQDKWPIQR